MAQKTIKVLLMAITGQYQAGMAGAATTTQAFGSAASTAGTRAGGMQTQMGMLTPKVLAAGAAIGATALALKDAVGDAIEWESAFAGVRKTVDASEAEFAELASGIRDMSTEIPTSATELAGVAEAAGQLGIQTENIVGFTRTMADLGETTNLSAKEAATQLARFANIMGTSQEDFDRLGSSIVDLGNNFETTEAEIVEMSMRIAGAGRQIGLTEGDVFGLATALTSVGIKAQAGGTAISRVLVDIATEVATTGDRLDTFAEIAGMSAEQFSQAWQDTPADAFEAFIQGLAKVEEEGGNVLLILDELGLSDVRIQQAMLGMTAAADKFSDAMQTGNEAQEENVALSEEAQERYDTMAAKLDVLKNKWTDVTTTVGDAFIPVLDKGVTVLGFLADVAHPDTMTAIREFLGLEGADAATHLHNVREAGVGLGSGLAGAQGPVIDYGQALSETDRAAMDAVGAFSTLGEGLGDVTGATSDADRAAMDAVDSFLTLGEGLDDVGTAGFYAADGIAASAEEAMKQADPVFALFDAWRDYEEAQTAANEAIAEHGATSHEAVQAGQDLVLALIELQDAAVNGDVDFATFEATLNRWVDQGRITEEQAYAIQHGVDHARESAEEYEGDYPATVGLDGGDEVLEEVDFIDRHLRALTEGVHTYDVDVNVNSAGGTVPGGLRPQGRASGGPLRAGMDYIVGEKGPELLQMGRSGGFVTPMSGASTTTDNSRKFEAHVEQHFHGRDADPQMAGFRANHELRGLAMMLGG